MGKYVPGGNQLGQQAAKHIFPGSQGVIAALLSPDDQGQFLLSSWCLLFFSAAPWSRETQTIEVTTLA